MDLGRSAARLGVHSGSLFAIAESWWFDVVLEFPFKERNLTLAALQAGLIFSGSVDFATNLDWNLGVWFPTFLLFLACLLRCTALLSP